MEPKKLTLGTELPSPDVLEEHARIEILKLTIEKYIPDFAESIAAVSKEADSILVLQQDAFAAAYDDDEYMLLGMAIKYAGLHSVEMRIVGASGETF